MLPFERFQKSNREGNLWVYLLSLAKNGEIINEDARRLIFEKFGFLPGKFLVSRVLYRLKQQGFVSDERNKGKKAYKITPQGLEELEKMRAFCQVLIDKI